MWFDISIFGGETSSGSLCRHTACWEAGPQCAVPQPVLLAHLKRCLVVVQGDSSAGIASKSTENVVLPPHTVSTDAVKTLKILSQKHFRIS